MDPQTTVNDVVLYHDGKSISLFRFNNGFQMLPVFYSENEQDPLGIHFIADGNGEFIENIYTNQILLNYSIASEKPKVI